jgi:hypothetical protein
MVRRCQAWRCPLLVAAGVVMCKRHWSLVPRELQRRVWATAGPGQELEHAKALRDAIAAVGAVEGLDRARQSLGGLGLSLRGASA